MCLLEDREENLWVGTGGGGLNRLQLPVLELVNPGSSRVSESEALLDPHGLGAFTVLEYRAH